MVVILGSRGRPLSQTETEQLNERPIGPQPDVFQPAVFPADEELHRPGVVPVELLPRELRPVDVHIDDQELNENLDNRGDEQGPNENQLDVPELYDPVVQPEYFSWDWGWLFDEFDSWLPLIVFGLGLGIGGFINLPWWKDGKFLEFHQKLLIRDYKMKQQILSKKPPLFMKLLFGTGGIVTSLRSMFNKRRGRKR